MRTFLLAIATMVASFCTFSPQAWAGGAACEGYENILFCGELNGDCTVSSTDALIALRMAVGQREEVGQADLNHSDTVTAGDALEVLKIAVGSSPATYGCANQYSTKASQVATFASNGSRTNGNYAVGWFSPPGAELRDLFVFDTSGFPGTIGSALLHLSSAPNGQSYYPNASPSETFTLFDVVTDPATMTQGFPGTAGFDDLANGTAYGSVTAVKGQVHAILDVPLNAAGVQHLNDVSGQVLIGGAITTLTKVAENEYLFNGTGATNVRELIVRVE